MRTDIKIDTRQTACPNVPKYSYPQKYHVERGDFIIWMDQGTKYTGRIIGFTEDSGKRYIVTVMISLHGFISERWAEPHQVIKSHDGINCLYADKAKWFYGDDFMKTDPNIARDASNRIARDL